MSTVDDGRPATPLNPYTTICVAKVNGKEVGRIPASSPNASEYLQELAGFYGELQVDYEPDETGGLLAMLHGRR